MSSVCFQYDPFTIIMVGILKFVFLNLALYASADCTYTTINTRQHQVVFKYAKQHRSERDLPMCGFGEVCTVLHKRYWMPPLAERLCRCPVNEECPWKWTDNTDNHTMFLNSRSQLKFCSSITNMKHCNTKETALSVKTMNTGDDKTKYTVSARCYCPEGHYWRHYKTYRGINNLNNTTQYKKEYKCQMLRKCESLEFCGNVRTDQNSIFYRCSCPEGHYCLYRDKETYSVDELFYKGQAYRAICEPQNINNDQDDY